MDQNHREKSSPVFLLNCHKAGDWFKRINDRFYYFGKRWGSDREALDDDLLRRDDQLNKDSIEVFSRTAEELVRRAILESGQASYRAAPAGAR